MDAQQLTQAKILLGGAIQPGREGTSEVEDTSDINYLEMLTEMGDEHIAVLLKSQREQKGASNE